MIDLPTSVEPVKTTFLTFGWVTKRFPTMEPLPGITVNTPSGIPALSATSPSLIAVGGVYSAGFSTTVFPASRACANSQPAIGLGKF